MVELHVQVTVDAVKMRTILLAMADAVRALDAETVVGAEAWGGLIDRGTVALAFQKRQKGIET